jgi:hypothetical protein
LIRTKKKDLLGGIALLAVGVMFSWGAIKLGLGSGRDMGPGYFPLLAGAFVIASAFLTVVASFLGEDALPKVQWRPLLWICLSVMVFILVIQFFGLIPAAFVTVWTASMADDAFRVKQTAWLALGVCVATWLIFVYGLSLPIRPYIIPSF